MNETGRNRYALDLSVTMTEPLEGEHAEAAARLLAHDVEAWLKSEGWGYGRARVEDAFAPRAQFEHGDFHPHDGDTDNPNRDD